jgi:uncharacterized repeat protein (TIGR01451 family)
MKKYILLLFIFCLQLVPTKAQWVTIPDANFVSWLNQNYPTCMNGNQMDISCSQIINEDTLIIVGFGINDFTGLEHFTNLQKLNCSNNFVQNFPALPNSITSFSCTGCGLYSLPPLPNWLVELDCSYNSLDSLPTLPGSLSTLICLNTFLNSFPSLPPYLQTFVCWGSDLAISGLPALPSYLNYLDCSYSNLTNLPTLPGNLNRLMCGGNQLVSLPTLPSSLIYLECHQNQIITMPSFPGNLDTVYCFENLLTSLPSFPNSMTHMDCKDNLIDSLPTSTNRLVTFDCTNNQLTSLPTLDNYLKYLYCGNNLLSTIPAAPYSLVELFCNNNSISILPNFSSNNFSKLDCSYNQLTGLPFFGSHLNQLNCSFNQLTVLPTSFPGYLSKLNCSNNQLSYLPQFFPNWGFGLDCSFNQITSLGSIPQSAYQLICNNNQIECLPKLTNSIYSNSQWSTYFNISNNPITCLPNYINAMDSATLTIPLCVANDIINNPNNCNPSMGFSGIAYLDSNTNCAYDLNETGLPNISVNFLDTLTGQFGVSYSFSSGLFNYVTDASTYKISIDTLDKPYTVNCSYPGIDTMLTTTAAVPLRQNINFELKCKPIIDLKVQSITRQGLVFPGQNHLLKTIVGDASQWFGLNCADGDSGIVTITINGPVAFFGLPTNAQSPVISGNTFSYPVSNFGNVINTTNFALILITDTTAQQGDQVCIQVSIQTNSLESDTLNNHLFYCYEVVNSYDPNNKEVYPLDVLPGFNDWLTYTIHFQNTGSAPAINIQLQDSIDANLDEQTFEVINYSHYNETSLQNHVASFKFPNIFLPDSLTNPLGSQGFIQYKIRPKSNLPAGTQIKNTAYIYFDYNAPIITNTTQNNFQTVVSTINTTSEEQPFVLFPNPSTGIFMFKENKNIKTVEVFNMMGELILSQGNAKQINLQAFPKGIYVARINGAYVKRLVKE